MALNDLDEKRKGAGGTNRVQTTDIGNKPLTRIGASGDGKNTITKRSVHTGGAGDGVKRKIRNSKVSSDDFISDLAGGTGKSGTSRKSFGKFLSKERVALPDPTDTAGQLQTITRATKDIRGVAGAGPQRAGFSRGIQKGKPIRRDIIDDRPESILKVGGTDRGEPKDKNIITSKSVLKGTKLKGGGFTDQGSFKKGGKTLREISKQGKKVSPFSEQGIEQLFGSAADLAKLFTSKEFQSRKAKGIQSAAGVKGRRADTKAKTEKIKALSGVLEDLSASGGDNEGLMANVQEQIQNLISGNDGSGPSGEVLGKLASQFEPDQVKTILGILQ